MQPHALRDLLDDPQIFARLAGRPVTLENRPGADGYIAAEAVMRAEPDGHTLFFATQSLFAIDPFVKKRQPMDPMQVFLPLAVVFDDDTPLRLILATLFRAGEIEVTYQGNRYHNYQDPASRTPFTNNPAFRSSLFSPRQSVGLKTLTQAVQQLEDLTGEEVDVEDLSTGIGSSSPLHQGSSGPYLIKMILIEVPDFIGLARSTSCKRSYSSNPSILLATT